MVVGYIQKIASSIVYCGIYKTCTLGGYSNYERSDRKLVKAKARVEWLLILDAEMWVFLMRNKGNGVTGIVRNSLSDTEPELTRIGF